LFLEFICFRAEGILPDDGGPAPKITTSILFEFEFWDILIN
jgi:hypothetical protein